MKTACIIGAGPAGLVSAKTLLQTGQFEVTIYEKASRLGGIWALDENSRGSYLSPHTPTNLSRFTVGFSDLSWDSVEITSRTSEHQDDGNPPPRKVPMFPRAWQVNRYLQAYRQRYIPEHLVHYEHEVIATRCRKQLAKGAQTHWVVTTRDKTATEQERVFDHLIVASGFFAKPRPLSQDVSITGAGIQAIHSSHFRNLSDLGPELKNKKRILLIGGGNSSGEAAAAIANQLSNAQWSPNQDGRTQYEGCKVIHVTPRPFYALPPYTPAGETSTTFMPLDFNFYNLSKRLPGPITGNAGKVSEQVKNILHGATQGSIGGDQSDLGAEALVAPGEGGERGAVQVALAETYAEFVRSGLIEVVAGRVQSIDAAAGKAQLDRGSELEDIGAVVYATGYSPEPALHFLHPETKKALHFDPESMRLPLILEQWQTSSARACNMSFIGFYEGPYWPVMEMQARLTASRWLNPDSPNPTTKPYEEVNTLLSLRQAMKDRGLDVPQYWFGDYAGYMEELASLLNLSRNDSPFTAEREGPVCPARYLASGDDRGEADKTMRDLQETWHAGRYVPRAAFRALQGHWLIERRITGNSGGTLTGTASFHPRRPTDKGFDGEYLYAETGTFTLSTGQTLTASRRYVYRYSEASDQLSVWFVKPEKELEVDYLFHDLTFISPVEAREAGANVAKADHLCVEDMYWTEYRLPIKGIALHEFTVKHTVKGPQKDYVAVTEYRRPEKGLR